jgi:hypothetical protein
MMNSNVEAVVYNYLYWLRTGVCNSWPAGVFYIARVLFFLRFHVRSVYRKVLWPSKIGLGILADLHVFSLAKYERIIVWNAVSLSLSVCLYVYVWPPSLAPEGLYEFFGLIY